MRNRALLLGLVLIMAAGCRVSEDEDGEGVEIEPATVEIQPDTKTVVVPDVDIGSDTTVRDTTPR
ncbi:MAG TPA: hypothetical protein VFZ04_10905 [Longimicrobiales bacterium]|jgi:hypothetical protein